MTGMEESKFSPEHAAHHLTLINDMSIAAHRNAIETTRRDVCECGEKIPDERISIRCITCQTELEKVKYKRF